MTQHEQDKAATVAAEEAAKRSEQSGIADESAAYTDAIAPTEDGGAAEDSAAHPS